MLRCARSLSVVLLLALTHLGCSSETRDGSLSVVDVERALVEGFPEQAPHLLESPARFSARKGGFAVSSEVDGSRRGLAMALPSRAEGGITLRAEGGFHAVVREEGLMGQGELVGTAVVYPSEQGASLWTATVDGFEEWLLLAEGAAKRDHVVAAWTVDGATLSQRGEAVALVDESGAARAWVTAPAAFARGGRQVDLALSVRGARIELVVDADGEAVLVDPSWSAAAPMSTARSDAIGAALMSGKVLVAGGFSALSSAELYDPATNTWSAAGSMAVGRHNHAAALLNSGKVLVCGGGLGGGLATASAELYDPATNAWSAAPPMISAREYHTATRLENGKVLVAGGYGVAAAELYDPISNTWAAAASMGMPRGFHRAAPLPGGKVLVAGGSIDGSVPLATAQIYDPATDTWAAAASMSTGRANATATALPSGKVLVVSGMGNGVYPVTAEIYDPFMNIWSGAGSIQNGRSYHSATPLSNGKVLIAGGSGLGAPPVGTWLYDPPTNMWSSAGSLATARSSHIAAPISSFKVLVAGGFGAAALSSAEIFSFGELGGACAAASDCQSGFCVDGVCCDSACGAGACDACSVAAGAPANGTCALLTGPACNDGSACTQVDACQAGVCVGGSPVVCAALDQCHTAGVCNAMTGLCSNPNKPNGSACNDGSACTQVDACQAGACVGGSPVVCAALDQCHMAGACNAMTGLCSNPNKPNGSACDDGSACTQVDACQAGACVGGSPVLCAALDQCHTNGVCDQATGVCSNPAKQDGSACDDGDACTQADACQAGACAGGSPVVCAAQDECHDAGVCDSIVGCSNPSKPDGAPCSLGACEQGVCKPAGGAGGAGGGVASSSSSGAGGGVGGAGVGGAGGGTSAAGGAGGASHAGGGASSEGGGRADPAGGSDSGCACRAASASHVDSRGALGAALAALLLAVARRGPRRPAKRA